MFVGESEYNIATLVAYLKNVMSIRNEAEGNRKIVMEILDYLIKENSIQETIDILPNDTFVMLLGDKSKEIIVQTAKAIAEIAKTERGREKCTNAHVVKALMKLLEEENINILIQASRALGNICYQNKNGKIMVKEKDGLKNIFLILRKAIDMKDTKGSDILRKVASGLLLNFLVDQECLQQQALEENIVQVLCHILEIDGTNGGETVTHILMTLDMFNDANVILLDEELIKVIVKILSSSKSLEISEMCLELLYDQADNEKVKFLLTQANVPEFLLKLIETYGPQCTNEEIRSALKVACNLIILILTGDDSMNMLYNNSKGTVYKHFVKWLDSTDEDYQVTAILAMGNFARTDDHCKLMVEQDIHKKLLTLLQKNYSKNSDIRFQHALLSTLHNLVIPAVNKSIILKDGLITILYPMLDIPTYPIVFKLLGTLRIVIDGQKEAAISLGTKEDLVERTVKWCCINDHPGVQSEANRLLAWLINNSKDKSVATVIIKLGGTQHLIKMILAEHTLMQNEAILSLTFLTTMCLLELENLLIEENIGHVLLRFFKEHISDIELPIISNMLSLIDNIVKSDVLKQHLKSTMGLSKILKSIFDSKNFYSIPKEKIEVVLNAISSSD